MAIVDQDPLSDYGYTGEWWEGEVGLLYLRARWYAPETGTFLSVDPVESEPPYLYVRGNPVNLTNPTGRFPEQCHWSNTREEYEKCVLGYYGLFPATLEAGSCLAHYFYFPVSSGAVENAYKDEELVKDVDGEARCYYGPVPYLDYAYLEGVGLNFMQQGLITPSVVLPQMITSVLEQVCMLGKGGVFKVTWSYLKRIIWVGEVISLAGLIIEV